MPKYISRTSSSSKSTDSLRDSLLKDLEKQGASLLKKMTDQFTKDLQDQTSRVLDGVFGNSTGSSASGSGAGASFGIQAATGLISSLISYAISKPKTSNSTRESDRSKAEAANFRLSRSQAMAEATAQLAKSERNF